MYYCVSSDAAKDLNLQTFVDLLLHLYGSVMSNSYFSLRIQHVNDCVGVRLHQRLFSVTTLLGCWRGTRIFKSSKPGRKIFPTKHFCSVEAHCDGNSKITS